MPAYKKVNPIQRKVSKPRVMNLRKLQAPGKFASNKLLKVPKLKF